jgi:hypothetical protein
MTNRMIDTTVDRPAPAARPPSPASSDRTAKVRRAAVVAGVTLLLTAASAAFGNVVVVQGLVTPGNAARTARDIAGSDGLFRLGLESLYLAVLFDVVVAWALLRVFSPVDRHLSRLAAWFRLAYSAVFMVSLSQLAGIPRLLTTEGYAAAFTPQQRQGQAMLKVDTFHDIWFAGLVLFGAHLALVGYLAYRSGFVPRGIGVLLVVAGAGYAYDSFAALLTEGPAFAVSNVTFVGELLLGLWLLLRGHRISPAADRHVL